MPGIALAYRLDRMLSTRISLDVTRPPPRITVAGLRMVTALARDRPIALPAFRVSSVAKGSPMRAAIATSWAVTLSPLP